MDKSRIPEFDDKTFDGMAAWFADMSRLGLLFHPDDSPEHIFSIATGEKTFSISECRQLDAIVKDMFERFGGKVYDAAYPVFMECIGIAA